MEIVTESLHDIVEDPIAAASNTDETSASIDMTGFQCALFILPITDSVSTGKAELRVQASTDNMTFGDLDIDEVSATSAANDDLNGHVLRIEVKRPLHRYLRARILSTAANIAFGATHALRYGSFRTPPPGDGDVLAEEVVASPALDS
ncbi:MAG: hypothetical protein OXP73_02015 [Chloroflexota bacterium]|nr:hypothetical protein [Chloroflexota bacterium]